MDAIAFCNLCTSARISNTWQKHRYEMRKNIFMFNLGLLRLDCDSDYFSSSSSYYYNYCDYYYYCHAKSILLLLLSIIATTTTWQKHRYELSNNPFGYGCASDSNEMVRPLHVIGVLVTVVVLVVIGGVVVAY